MSHREVNQSKLHGILRGMEKAMAPHSSTLAWEIPWTQEPGGLQSMESLRVAQDWVTSLSLFTFMHWRRKWQPTPVFLPGESQERGSLVGCRLWGRTEWDTTEATAAAAAEITMSSMRSMTQWVLEMILSKKDLLPYFALLPSLSSIHCQPKRRQATKLK